MFDLSFMRLTQINLVSLQHSEPVCNNVVEEIVGKDQKKEKQEGLDRSKLNDERLDQIKIFRIEQRKNRTF